MEQVCRMRAPMTQDIRDIDDLARIARERASGERTLIALAGPPASGKSTLAEALVAELSKTDPAATLVPMDGFHLDNSVLYSRGLFERKGAPETFDAAGFVAAMQRLKAGGEVILPTFDRARDNSVAGAIVVPDAARFVVVEGNFLCFDEEPWSALSQLWDLSCYLDVPVETLRERLIQRWLDHGLDPEAARTRAEENDLANAVRVSDAIGAPDIRIAAALDIE